MFSLIGRFDAGLNALWANEYIGLQTRTVKGLPDGSVLAAGDSVLLKLTPAGTVDWAEVHLCGKRSDGRHGGEARWACAPAGLDHGCGHLFLDRAWMLLAPCLGPSVRGRG